MGWNTGNEDDNDDGGSGMVVGKAILAIEWWLWW